MSPKQRGRVGLKELSQLNQIFELPQTEIKMEKRISTRIRFKNKLKDFTSSNQAGNEPLKMEDNSTDEMTHLTASLKERNPADKILLLKMLGLIPTPQLDTQLQNEPPQIYPPPTNNNAGESTTQEEINYEDLDLEIVFCPLDIPEIYEDIMKKPFPKLPPLESESCHRN